MTRLTAIALPMITALTLWSVIVWAWAFPHFILPSPWRVATAMVDNWRSLAFHAGITLSEVLLGCLLGMLLGVATALVLALIPRLRPIIRPILIFTQGAPVYALAPILVIWFGYGIWSKVAMAMLIIYFPVASAFLDGLMRTPPGFLDQARVMGASAMRTMMLIRVPSALPSLGTGMRLAAVYAPIGAMFGEWVGASQGLGYLMLLSNGRAKIDVMFAAVIVLAVMAVLLHMVVDRLATRLSPES